MNRKRVFDLSLLLPLLPLFALAVAVLALLALGTHGRPLFFQQIRLGRDRRPFRIWKLRTLTTEPDPLARRPTRFGGWMRRRGLDELPQLFNVLRGDMSLVGPRPLTPADVQRLVGLHAPLAHRFRVPPGLTGLAQVAGARGAALTAALDNEYAETRSVARDLTILLRTFWINLVGKRLGTRGTKATR
ncbi:MAG TPA: sugar transferase [Polyangia bacterium]|jgi:lipopolysaccharide/colanic/teichoic acid biosynthesis glycosyltransferase|nr:sugar transferase [Polyangia bacterium]